MDKKKNANISVIRKENDMIRRLLCATLLFGACSAFAGTFLDSLNADSRKVASSPVATGGDIILKDGDDIVIVRYSSGPIVEAKPIETGMAFFKADVTVENLAEGATADLYASWAGKDAVKLGENLANGASVSATFTGFESGAMAEVLLWAVSGGKKSLVQTVKTQLLSNEKRRAKGGVETEITLEDGQKAYVNQFNESGTFEIVDDIENVRMLLVGGGGAGGSNRGGGGGAGGFVEATSDVLGSGELAVVIGAGGQVTSDIGGMGGDTKILRNGAEFFVAHGGGGGGGNAKDATAGASGGGNSAQGSSGYYAKTIYPVEGHNGGVGHTSAGDNAAGGGGGAAAAGEDGNSSGNVSGANARRAGSGGDAKMSDITGEWRGYAAGGGGGCWCDGKGMRGLGGKDANGNVVGGNGSGYREDESDFSTALAATAPVQSTGSGGGGGSANTSYGSGTAGANGVVIFQYTTGEPLVCGDDPIVDKVRVAVAENGCALVTIPVNWAGAGCETVAGQVVVSSDDDPMFATVVPFADAVGMTEILIDGLLPGKTYSFVATVQNANEKSVTSNVATLTTPVEAGEGCEIVEAVKGANTFTATLGFDALDGEASIKVCTGDALPLTADQTAWTTVLDGGSASAGATEANAEVALASLGTYVRFAVVGASGTFWSPTMRVADAGDAAAPSVDFATTEVGIAFVKGRVTLTRVGEGSTCADIYAAWCDMGGTLPTAVKIAEGVKPGESVDYTFTGFTDQGTATLTVYAVNDDEESSAVLRRLIALVSLAKNPGEGGSRFSLGDGTYCHKFTASGMLSLPNEVENVRVLLVGGGGAGGGLRGGGGGAGGFVDKTLSECVDAGTYEITVGFGGAASSGKGGNGGDSTFVGGDISLIAHGGGGGGCQGNTAGAAGASGGGGGGGGTAGAANHDADEYGFPGGGTSGGDNAAGGGGGASSAGGIGNASGNKTGTNARRAGSGGDAKMSDITGVEQWFAAGGGGGCWCDGSGGMRGMGGTDGSGNILGGNGSGYKEDESDFSTKLAATAPVQSTGSGGGGGSANTSYGSGTAGACGVVIVRYSLPVVDLGAEPMVELVSLGKPDETKPKGLATVNVTWAGEGCGTVTAEIRYREKGTEDAWQSAKSVENVIGQNALDFKLKGGKTYEVKVVATNANGKSAESDVLEITMPEVKDSAGVMLIFH